MFRFLILCLSIATTAAAATPAFDPRTAKTAIAGPPTEVLVLGSPHLSELHGSFRPELLSSLLDHLAAWKPDMITVENLSGQECDILLRYEAIYKDTWDGYCWGTEEAEKATGLTVPQAMAAIDKTLASWPASPSPADRRRLASLFLAANDRPSAQVQWLRLPAAERHAGDGLNDALVAILGRKPGHYNESIDIGAALAARIGLERIYLIDDHTADSSAIDDPAAYGAAIQKAWHAQEPVAVHDEAERRSKSLHSPADLLDLYRFFNQPATQRQWIAADMGAAAREPSKEHWGRQYVGWWETRDLRMVANIRQASAAHPGSRILAIVGATHKPYFDAYLDMMQDVRVDDVEQVLR